MSQGLEGMTEAYPGGIEQNTSLSRGPFISVPGGGGGVYLQLLSSIGVYD